MLTAAWLGIWASGGVLWGATNPHFSVRVWDTEDRLPSSAVIAMTQTRDGYLWLGTLNGLARFDGVRFTTYNEGNTPELSSSQIVKLFEDSAGDLWIGTETAGIYVVMNGKVKRVTDVGQQGRLVSICEDAAGAIWLYTATGQLCRYYHDRGDVWNAGADFPSRCRALAPEGKLLWVGTDRSLTALGPVSAGPAAGLPVAYEMPVQRLDFLLTGSGGGYWRLADGRIQKWRGDHLERDLTAYPWSADTPVTAACEDREGNLVVGTYGEGVFWFNAAGQAVHLASELSHHFILSLTVDREGCLWVGTNGRGLDRVKRQVFDVLPITQNLAVQSVVEDAQGGLWIGYNGERIDHWQEGKLEQHTRVAGRANWYVHSVFVDREQQVWAGTFSGGLFRLAESKFEPVPGVEQADISAICQDHRGRLWVGTQTGLACRDAGRWSVITIKDGLSADVIRAIAEDAAGNLWVGTDGGGVNRLREGRWSSFGKTNGLPSNSVSALHIDTNGVIWAVTASGLARCEQDKWFSYADRPELAETSAGYLLEDGEGYLWIGSNAGLVRVRKKELDAMAAGGTDSLRVRTYGKHDGLPTGECSQGSQPAACRARNETLWFPTTEGLVSVNPAALQPNTNRPPVLIESVLIDGRLQGANALRAPAPEAVTVPADKESIEIHYTSLNLSAPDMGLFKYRLEGHESSWTERPGNIRYARYSRLPPGTYRFRVQACNEDGLWNEEGAALLVRVLPPFWRTWWFMTATSLALLGLVVASVHYASTQKLQQQLAVLRQQEALEKERARIARDLHDQLGANLTQVALLGEMAEADKDLPAEVVAHARQISQTARDTTHALDEIVWTVNPSNDTLDGLVNYVCKYAQEYLALAGLRYRLEVPSALPAVPISPELRHNVFLAAKEAVNNVVKHAQATSAWLRLRIEVDRFVLEIEDNGRGLPAGHENKGRNGLRNMRKRMEDIGGRFDASPGAEGGTRVRLTAPLPTKA